jgi:threonine dehydratase
VTTPTPLELAPASIARGRDLWLKREDVHELGSFKWRGALPTLREYQTQRGAATVVTASTGNHGAATAWAASELGMRAVVFAPENTSQTKRARMYKWGADLRLTGTDLDEAKEAAQRYANAESVPFFEDGAEPAQYAAYRAIGREILDQAPRTPEAIVIPVGNGALFAGIGAELRDKAPQTRRIAVVPEAAPVMALSHEAGRPVACDRCDTFADGLAVRVAIPQAVEALRDLVDEYVQVTERAIATAVGAYARAGLRVEGAAAAALAALDGHLETNGPTVLIVTGSNIDDGLHSRAVEHPESFEL